MALSASRIISADDRLMQEQALDIVSGALILQKMVQAEKIVIAIEESKTLAITAIVARAKRSVPRELRTELAGTLRLARRYECRNLEIVIIPNGYPAAAKSSSFTLSAASKSLLNNYPKNMFCMFNVATAKAITMQC